MAGGMYPYGPQIRYFGTSEGGHFEGVLIALYKHKIFVQGVI
jgi:hypothetical protein